MSSGQDDPNENPTKIASAAATETADNIGSKEAQISGAGDETTVANKKHDNDSVAQDKQKDVILDEDGNPLSKNQLKKRRRWERAMEVKKRRKQQDKDIKLAKAKAQGRDLEQEKIELKKRTEEGINRKKRQEEWETKYLPRAKKSWQVCIDCSFEDEMMTKEINSLSNQIRYCYSNNKRNSHPCLLTVSSLSGQTKQNLERVSGFEDWNLRAFSYSEKPLNEIFQDRLKDVVYLTSDSENVVEHLDDSKIYVIGGMYRLASLRNIFVFCGQNDPQ